MFQQPKGYKPNGQLRDCDRCGFTYRWIQLRVQNGIFVCPQCLDMEVRKRTR